MADEIAVWLEELGLGQCAQAFVENGIDLDILPSLTEDDLKELGLNLGDRRRLQRALRSASPSRGDPVGSEPTKERIASNPEAERRQLTVLFCDLVGSTALSARLDPEDMRSLLRAYQDACAGVIARFGGYVAKFMGDGVYAYFGYPVAHEDDAERAINAGLGIVATVGGLGRDLRVRIGIATGTVAVGDIVGEGAAEEANVVGEAPNLAARLQEIAEPNAVVIGEATRALTGGLFETEDLGGHDLKGFAERVRAWAVLRPRRAESRFEATRGGGLTELVGREEEVGILERRWKRTIAGNGQVVLISGEPGIGKSRLARAIDERIAEAPHTRLGFQCSPYHTASALHPVIEHLERAARIESTDAASARLEKLDRLLKSSAVPREAGALFAELLSIPTEGRYPALNVTPQRKMDLTLEALVDRLTALAADRPVLLLFEDAHWIDPTSQELLDRTVDRLAGKPILMIVTYRPEYVSSWVGRANVATITLNRLDRSESAAMAERVTGGRPLPPGVLDQIIAKTDGVPLFVEELTKSIVESGLLAGVDHGDATLAPLPEPAIPATLQDSLEARLDRLGPAKEVAHVGAAIGREFDYRLLAAVAGMDGAALDAALAELVGSELVFRRGTPPDATFTFKHALVRDAAYESLLRTRRQQLHGSIATCLDERFPDIAESQPELLAQHFFAAGDTLSAIRFWKRAGERASRVSANREAIAHFERALELVATLEATPDRARLELDLQIGLGPPLLAIHGWGSAEPEQCYVRALELCRELGAVDALGPVLWGLWVINQVRKNNDRTRELVGQLFALADRSGDPVHALVAHHAAWGNPYGGNFADQLNHTDAGLAIYDTESHGAMALRYGGHDPGCCALTHKSIAQWALGFPDRSVESNDRSISVAEATRHGPSIALALHHRVWMDVFRKDWHAVRQTSEQVMTYSREIGFPVFMPQALVQRGWARVNLGDPEGLADIILGIERLEAIGMRIGLATFRAIHADSLGRLGRTEEALEVLDEALEMADRHEERLWEANGHRLKGELLLASSPRDTAAAVACFERAIDVARQQDARMWELGASISLARLRHAQGDAKAARDILAPIHGWFTEGLETADLKDAKALLDELS